MRTLLRTLPRTPLLLLCLGLVVHGAWALTLPGPIDWDPAAALEVARALARGQGAVSRATWSLALLPLAEAHQGLTPAWLHWMPLPSLVTVPAVALFGEPGSRLMSVFLGACWAPLAWALSRALGQESTALGRDRAALLAGLLAAAGGGYARFLSTPDSIALYGLVGSLGWLAVARARTAATGTATALATALTAALAALTRGDGFLLAPCLALGLWRQGQRRGAVLTAFAGPIAAAVWWGRNWSVAGDTALSMRRAAANAVDLVGLVGGQPAVLGLGPRLAHLATATPGLFKVAFAVGLGILPILALFGAWRQRLSPVVLGAASYLVAMPALTLIAAPGVAGSGTPFRSGAALFPLACALASSASIWLGDQARARRAYPSAFVPGLVLLAFALGSIGAGLMTRAARPHATVDCQALAPVPAQAPLLAADPLLVTALCDRPATVIPASLDPDAVQALAQRVGAHFALVAPSGSASAGLNQDQAPAILRGWTDQGGGLWSRP
ncbi:MAG: hypothetical protein GXP62_05940 [Oligoflexia bacterium]|nr:hypothetical protein [Oligoflexia bacterium]